MDKHFIRTNNFCCHPIFKLGSLSCTTRHDFTTAVMRMHILAMTKMTRTRQFYIRQFEGILITYEVTIPFTIAQSSTTTLPPS